MDLSLSRAAKFVILSILISHCRSPKTNETLRPVKPPVSLVATGGGGVIEGNGGEYITNEQNPWFLGQAPVLYCIVQDATAFSPSLEQTRNSINEALQTWQDFFKVKKPAGLPPSFVLAAKDAITLSLDFQEVSCEQNHELEFHLGVKDSVIESALKYSADNVVALSYREDYSDETGRARGQVWLTADLGESIYRGPNPGPGFWTKDYNLTNVLTHELGHVFGVRHSEKGLMAAEFPAKLLKFGMKPRVTSDSIESPNQICGLFYLKDGPFDPQGSLVKIFGVDYQDLDQVCFSYDRDKAIKAGIPYRIDLILKDGSSKAFSGLVNDEEPLYAFIGGQFFKETETKDVRYSPFSFLPIVKSFEGQGIQYTDFGNYLMALSSHQPSTLSFKIGYNGAWQEFFLIKNTKEVWGMLNLLHPARGGYE